MSNTINFHERFCDVAHGEKLMEASTHLLAYLEEHGIKGEPALNCREHSGRYPTLSLLFNSAQEALDAQTMLTAEKPWATNGNIRVQASTMIVPTTHVKSQKEAITFFAGQDIVLDFAQELHPFPAAAAPVHARA